LRGWACSALGLICKWAAKGMEIIETALGKLMHKIWYRLNDDERLLLLVSKKKGQGWNIKDVCVRVERLAKYVLTA
jgi:hypothetical protein